MHEFNAAGGEKFRASGVIAEFFDVGGNLWKHRALSKAGARVRPWLTFGRCKHMQAVSRDRAPISCQPDPDDKVQG